MLSHNEYVIWTIENKTLRVAVGICNNADTPIVYLKDLIALKEGYYNCYSFYDGAMTMEQAKEIIEASKNGNNRAVPNLIKKYFDIDSSLRFYEDIGYTQLTDMVCDEWFDSVKMLVTFLDDRRFKGYYEIDVEVEVDDCFEESDEMS